MGKDLVMTSFSCPHCGAALRVSDGLAGRHGKCSKCGGSVLVPSPSDTKQPSAELRESVSPLQGESSKVDPEDSGKPAATFWGGRGWRNPALPIGVGGALVAALVIWLLWWHGGVQRDDQAFVFAKDLARTAANDLAAAVKAYQTYLEEYPEGRHVSEAREQMGGLSEAWATEARGVAASAKEAAGAAGAAQHANAEWSAANHLAADAETAFKKKDFLSARERWTAAQSQYRAAERQVRTIGPQLAAQRVALWKQGGTPLLGHTDAVSALRFSRDGKILVSASADWTVCMWDPYTREHVATLRDHNDRIMSLALSPNGELLASGGADGSIFLWNVRSRSRSAVLRGHEALVCGLAFSPDGRYLASAGPEGTIRLWETQTHKELPSVTSGPDPIISLAFSPDGRLLASGSANKMVRFWDVRARREVASLAGHDNAVSSVAFSPNGSLLASASWDKHIRIWDVRSRGLVAAIKGCRTILWGVVFSPDGRMLISSSADNTLCVWDVGTGKELAALRGHDDYVMSVAISPDGELLASGGKDGTILLWGGAEGTSARTGGAEGPTSSHEDRLPTASSMAESGNSLQDEPELPSSPESSTPLGVYVGVFRYSGQKLAARASLNSEDAVYRPIEAVNLRDVVRGSVSCGPDEAFFAVQLQTKKPNNPKFSFGEFTLSWGSGKDSPQAYSTDRKGETAWAIGPNVTSERKTPGSTYLWFKVPKSAKVGDLAYKNQSVKVSLENAKQP